MNGKIRWPDNQDDADEEEDEMMPQVGHWYRDTDEDETFEVVAINEDFIEIQFDDGDVEEIAVECWKEFNLVPAEKP